MNERQGIVAAEITTAAPVGANERDVLERRIEQMTGKRVEVQFKTDPSLIGGAVTRIGSTVYDGSIRTRLESIKEELKRGGA
jgi:F-type H+-transporting ATPase subunit delta